MAQNESWECAATAKWGASSLLEFYDLLFSIPLSLILHRREFVSDIVEFLTLLLSFMPFEATSWCKLPVSWCEDEDGNMEGDEEGESLRLNIFTPSPIKESNCWS